MGQLRKSCSETEVLRSRVVLRGAVQGVGFRPFVFRLANQLGLTGWVQNSTQGVVVEVEGDEAALREFLFRIENEKPAAAVLQSIASSWLKPIGANGFEIRESCDGEKTTLLLPDLATCRDCLSDIDDPTNRRYRYPFTNCTNCGPRFSIIESLPYDRSRTTMKKFIMCAECESEYQDPTNRRFHAQPNACPACGPHLELWDKKGKSLEINDGALVHAAEAIRTGAVVAVKGLGGFHLIASAMDDMVVGELRRRKGRQAKPFALMFPSMDMVPSDCECSDIELRLLQSAAAPIVLLKRKPCQGNTVVNAVAPGNPYLGIMLPYTPLHHLLMRELNFPVIATSGNLSEEPICFDESEALERLHGIADLFLVHDRPIVRHIDDSVVRENAGRELIIRRARGYAPLPVELRDAVRPIVALGAHQKNTIAVSVGTAAVISQHIGDLDTPQSLLAFERVNAAFQSMYDLAPAAFACDMHPDYTSTKYAVKSGKPVIAVQHHYAHVLSCMAENKLNPPVLGIAWDGTGYGLDGTMWGGEFLDVTEDGFTRVASLRTFPLPGGEKAVREPRRTALGLLYEVFGEDAFQLDLPPVRAFAPQELKLLRSMLRNNVHCPHTSSVGRLFDVVSSLTDVRQICEFEGQAAMELEFAADDSTDCYPYEVRAQESRLVIDWRPMLRSIVQEDRCLARRSKVFHNTLAAMAADVAQRVGESRVVLSGGCFQNRVLTESVILRLQSAGFEVYWHRQVPPNDGGIALGQLVAAASERKRNSGTR